MRFSLRRLLGSLLARPETPASLLAAFNGMPISGSWILKVVDDSAGDTGTLNSWRLRLVF